MKPSGQHVRDLGSQPRVAQEASNRYYLLDVATTTAVRGDLQEVLAAVARGVLGEGYAGDIPARMRSKLDEFPPADGRKLLSALRVLRSTAGSLALTGRATSAGRWSAPEAEATVQRWLASKIPAKRQLAKALVALSTSALYGFPGSEWDRIGYPGPLGPAPEGPRRLQPIEVEHPEELRCDVVVVGSGAGGGCAAARLAEAGLDVVVLERGGYRAEPDFDHLEPAALSDMYLYGGTLATTDLGVLILAGSTLGGGTVVNYTTSFHTPDFVLREWTARTGIAAFASGEFDASLDEVALRIGVNRESSRPSRRDELVEAGLQKLGWDLDVLPRAVRGCSQDDQCGYCGFGCRLGAKQSAMRTFLEDAAGSGARMVIHANARRVLIEDGRATGVEAEASGHRLVVRAKAVVAAGGAIETPALLLRSRLGRRGQVGRHLHLHPGVGTFAVFDEPVRMWTGTLQARYSRQLRDRDRSYGPILETVPVHPGLGSAAMPWASAKQHRELMGKFDHLGFCAVLPRDTTAGRVRVARDGSVRVHYELGSDDERRMVDGLVAAATVLEAAGAREIFSLHSPPISYRPGGDQRGRHARWADEVRATGIRGRLTGFSFHQMGSCRMGTDPATSAVGPDNETHEVRGLYVMDASAFPTASGVNPMLTVYGIASMAAKKLAERLS
jgi:choline dehydrogenase-like flavoprotein